MQERWSVLERRGGVCKRGEGECATDLEGECAREVECAREERGSVLERRGAVCYRSRGGVCKRGGVC